MPPDGTTVTRRRRTPTATGLNTVSFSRHIISTPCPGNTILRMLPLQRAHGTRYAPPPKAGALPDATGSIHGTVAGPLPCPQRAERALPYTRQRGSTWRYVPHCVHRRRSDNSADADGLHVAGACGNFRQSGAACWLLQTSHLARPRATLRFELASRLVGDAGCLRATLVRDCLLGHCYRHATLTASAHSRAGLATRTWR